MRKASGGGGSLSSFFRLGEKRVEERRPDEGREICKLVSRSKRSKLIGVGSMSFTVSYLSLIVRHPFSICSIMLTYFVFPLSKDQAYETSLSGLGFSDAAHAHDDVDAAADFAAPPPTKKTTMPVSMPKSTPTPTRCF